MERIKVAVSPFYGGKNWTDEKTRVLFEKNPRGLNVYSIPNSLDLSGIEKAIRLNALILVEGNIGEYNEVKEITIDEPKAEEKEAPVEEVPVEEAPEEEAPVEEAPAEEKEEEEEVVVEAQEEKKPAAKRAPRKKAAPKK